MTATAESCTSLTHESRTPTKCYKNPFQGSYTPCLSLHTLCRYTNISVLKAFDSFLLSLPIWLLMKPEPQQIAYSLTHPTLVSLYVVLQSPEDRGLTWGSCKKRVISITSCPLLPSLASLITPNLHVACCFSQPPKNSFPPGLLPLGKI